MILKKSKGGSVFRKIAMGSWWTAGDPSVYGLLELDVQAALEWMHKKQQETGVRISVSHLVGKAAAIVMAERPEINGIIKRSRIYQRKHVDLFYQVNIPGGENDPVGKATLSGVTVRAAETLDTLQIAQVLNNKAMQLKNTGKGELTESARKVSWLPWWAMKYALNFSAFLNYDLGIPMTLFGFPRDPFGSIMITNVGALGGDLAFAPLVPYTRVPILLTVGKIEDRPWVVGKQVVVRPVIRIGVTFDHRFMDGAHAAAMNRRFHECFANPEKWF